jgi:hypothetical protein
MKVEIGTEDAQFPEKEYINGIFVALQCPGSGNCGSVINCHPWSSSGSVSLLLSRITDPDPNYFIKYYRRISKFFPHCFYRPPVSKRFGREFEPWLGLFNTCILVFLVA